MNNSARGVRPTAAIQYRSGGALRWRSVLALVIAIGALLASGAPDDARADVPLTGAAKVAAGDNHSCALTVGGGVKCWGSNTTGQLGNGGGASTLVAVDVSGMTSGVSALAAGNNHTCALTAAGGVKCWGYNWSGQLGDGGTSTAFVPVNVAGLSSGVIAIAAGNSHTCALTTGGGVKCWGGNFSGQLGDGTTNGALTAVDVTGLASGVTALGSGSSHTCAVSAVGGVKCWGANFGGQLGDGTTDTQLTPVDVSGLSSGVSALALGNSHTCALTTGGAVKCWGDNTSAQLGDGTTTPALTPIAVTGLTSGVSALSAGSLHTCAITGASGAKCWGGNLWGQIGNGSTANALTPVDVTGLTSGIAWVAAGSYHSCAATTGGAVNCWGDNADGQLGNGNPTSSWTPVAVVGLTSGVSAITAGTIHSCAVTGTGGAKCWGENFGGTLGNGTGSSLTPGDVLGLTSGMAAVTAGVYHSCGLTSAGGAKCWGLNLDGQVGNGTTGSVPSPQDVIGLTSGVTVLTAGGFHSCALTSGGGVKCWGYNDQGQLGNGSTTSSSTPVDVTGLTSGVIALEAGHYHTCAVTSTGGAKCWGYNLAGQLGNGSQSQALTPVDVTGLTSGVTSISAGSVHSCAIIAGGGVKCWGGSALLGDGTAFPSLTPVAVSGLVSGVTAISAGGTHTCALAAGGAAKCWGGNGYGELGNGNNITAYTPVDVSGLSSGVSVIAAGFGHSCAVVSGGAAQCWGDFSSSQLGDGSARYQPLPTQVLAAPPTTSTALAASINPSVFGQSILLTATITGGAPTGSVSFRDNGSSIAGCTAIVVAAGQAQCTTASLSAGGHLLSAQYSGDAANQPSATSVSHTVSRASTATAIVAHTPDPSLVLSPIAVSVSVTPVAPGAGTPTGTVSVSDGTVGCFFTLPATSCNLTPSTQGTKTLTAAYGGSGNFVFSTAPGVTHTVAALPQVISFGGLSNKVFGDPPFTLSATGGGSGNPVTFSASPAAVCTLTGNVITMVGAGICSVVADQAGGGIYGPATPVTQSFTVAQAAQAIVFGGLSGKVFGEPPFTLTATGGASGNAVLFSSTTLAICTVTSNTVTLVASGTCTIAANQAGSANYAAAPQVTQSFTVAQAAQVIVFGTVAGKTLGDPSFALVASGGASGNPVTFASTTAAICTVSASMVTLTGAGLCTINANQAAGGSYAAAPQVTQSFSVAKAAASVVLVASGNPSGFGQSVTFTATVSGGGATPSGTVTFDDGGTTICNAIPLNGSAVAACVTAALAVGQHAIGATYGGSANHLGASGSLVQTVNTASAAAYVFVDVDYPGAIESDIRSVNGNGQLVGVATLGATNTAFAYGNGVFGPLPPMPVGSGMVDVSPSWINEAGTIVGGATNSTTGPTLGRAFVFDGSNYMLFARPGMPFTEARALGAAGKVTGWAYDLGSLVSIPFIYDRTTATFTDIVIANPVGWRQVAHGINAAGQVVGSIDGNGPAQAFLREANATVTTFQVNGLPTRARGINDSGRIAGVVEVNGYLQGFVGNATDGYALLAVPGAIDTVVESINNKGQVSGFWRDAQGKAHGFIGTLAQLPVGFGAGGSFVFDAAVVANKSVFIDPPVAVGYDFAIGPGDPFFTSVRLPIGFGDNQYTVTAGSQSTIVAAGVVVDLRSRGAPSGVSAFRVTGIETSEYVDPADARAFPAELTFFASGQFTGSQTPLTANAPWPTQLALSSSINPSLNAQAVTFTATVGSAGGSPPGTVTFKDGATTLCSSTLSNGQAVCSSSTLATGSHSIGATFPGDANFGAAAQWLTQIVGQLAQTISFAVVPNQLMNAGPVALAATASSGLPVSFTSSTVLVCTVTSGVVTLKSAGTCTIVATQPGNANYAAAPSVTRTFNVSKAPQAITFAPLADRPLGSAVVTAATANSGLTVSLTSTTPSICGVSRGVVLFARGRCTLVANQAGDSTYQSAPPVAQSFTVQ